MSRRVAVTALSVVSALGRGLEANWKALLEGRSGIGPITHFDSSALRTHIAGEVRDFHPEDVIDSKDLRTMDFFIQYAYVCAAEAMAMAGFSKPIPENLQDRAGCIIGCGLGGLPEIEATSKIVHERGAGRIGPFFIPRLISNEAPGQIAMGWKLRGPNYTTTSACASGAHAIGESFRLIRSGVMDMMVTGGTESTITPLGVGGFNAMRALSTRNDEPTKASRPFDKNRDGFVCGEGAGLLVLEDWEHAQKRGAKILAEMIGYGTNCDAYHLTAPSEGGVGAAAAIKLALKDAGLNGPEVGAINAHGTSTPLGDLAETQAIKRAFGDHAKKLKVNSTKSMTGHTLGAAGGIEAVYAIKALMEQKLPPTINLTDPDPECDLDYVPNIAQDFKHTVALSNSFGFGGTNVSLIFRRA